MNIKKYIIYTGLASALLVGATSMVVADEINSHKPGDHDDQMEMKIKHGMESADKAGTQMILQVGPKGNVLMRGTIDAVGTDFLTVKTWGGDWNVNVPATANVLPVNDLTKFHVGDFVGVEGSVNQTAAFAVDARILRDWNLKKEMQELKDALNPKNWQGVVSNIDATAGTFTLTVDGTAYTVTVVAGAKIVNQNYATITLAHISNGDTVRVWAASSGTTMTAFIVRDTTIH